MAYSRLRPGPNCSPFSGYLPQERNSQAHGLKSTGFSLKVVDSCVFSAFMVLGFLLVVGTAASVIPLPDVFFPSHTALFDAAVPTTSHTAITQSLPQVFLFTGPSLRFQTTSALLALYVDANVSAALPSLNGMAGRRCAVARRTKDRFNCYGGEADESIRFMEQEPEPLLKESPTTEEWLAEMQVEQQQVEALDVVRRVYFSYGDAHNDNKAWATLWCCWQGGRCKALSVPCLQGVGPTHLEAPAESHSQTY
jgi:hypothetical protein